MKRCESIAMWFIIITMAVCNFFAYREIGKLKCNQAFLAKSLKEMTCESTKLFEKIIDTLYRKQEVE